MLAWRDDLGVPVQIREDDRFICSRGEFARWANGRRQYHMEFFYRDMRRKTGLLMDGDRPAGGEWNYDRENRKPLGEAPSRSMWRRFEPDGNTCGVMALVAEHFGDHFGELEPFGWAVTREDALYALQHFMTDCLGQFGGYQDAMKTGEDFLHHAAISPYLNADLLTAREVCEAAEAAYNTGGAPLNAAEGFIRQVIGWRKYVRGIYWLRMPDHAETNHLRATRELPWFYWSGETSMNCLSECIGATRQHAYAHHTRG